MRDVIDVALSNEAQHNGHHACGGERFGAARVLIGRYREPDELPVVQVMQIIREARDQEVLVDEREDIVDDRAGCDLALVVAVVVLKAVYEHLV